MSFSRSGGSWGSAISADGRSLSSVWTEGIRADRGGIDQPVLDWLEPGEAGKIPSSRLRSLVALGGDYGFDPRAWKATLPESLDTASVEEGRGRAIEKAFELAIWSSLATGEYTGETVLVAKECPRRDCAEKGRSCLEVSFEVEVKGTHDRRLVELYSWAEEAEPSGELPKIPGMRALTARLELEGVAHIVVTTGSGLLESAQIDAEILGDVRMDNYTSFFGYEWDGGVTDLSFSGQIEQHLEIRRD